MTINAFERQEIKFLLDEARFQAVLPALSPHLRLDRHCEQGQEYSVHNIYYDTADSRVIRRSLEKPYFKEKLRLRSYGAPATSESPVFLELKRKVGSRVSKRRTQLSLAQAGLFLEQGIMPAGAPYITRQVLNEIAVFQSRYPVQPAVYIGYRRIALAGSKDPDLRITFDHHIISRRQELHLGPGRPGRELLPSGQYLMEIKARYSLPVWLARILAQNRIYPASYSKYGQEYKLYMAEQTSRRELLRAG